MARRPTTWLLAPALAAALAGPAHAVQFCARADSSGAPHDGTTVKVRVACRSNEVAVSPGLGAVTVRTGNQITTNGSLGTVSNCEPGEIATGGGALSVGNDGGQPAMRSSRPTPDTDGALPTGWRVAVANANPGTGTITVTAYAVCVAQQ